MHKIGDKVKVSQDNDNDNYDSFRNKVLIITNVTTSAEEHQAFDDGLRGQGLYDFKDEDGNEIPCSLYDYELEKVN